MKEFGPGDWRLGTKTSTDSGLYHFKLIVTEVTSGMVNDSNTFTCKLYM